MTGAKWALVSLPLLVAACGTRREPPALPALPAGEATRFRGEAANVNRRCEGCHRAIAEEWRGSLHHQSFSNASFQRAFALEPLSFCQACHAPEADAQKAVPAALAALGVGCTSCHVASAEAVVELSNLEVLSTPARGAARAAPHGLLRASAFATNAVCAGCHEFAFPDAGARGRVALMQSTLSEQRTSAAGGEACASCHMPRQPGAHRSHAFRASRDRAFLRRAVTVTASRVAPNRVRVTLAPALLGHAFPTGDLFRRVVVEAEAVGADYRLLASDRRFLTCHFVRKRRSPSLDLLELRLDDRVGLSGQAPSVVELRLDASAGSAQVAWRVVYQRVAEPRGVDEADALVEAEEELASGWLAPDPALVASSQQSSQGK